MSKAIYWQRGEAIDYKNTTGKSIEANTIILLGSRIGVAGTDIPAGATGSLHVEGVFKIPKAEEEIAIGAELYWNDSESKVTATAGSNKKIGYAVESATSSDATALVKINA